MTHEEREKALVSLVGALRYDQRYHCLEPLNWEFLMVTSSCLNPKMLAWGGLEVYSPSYVGAVAALYDKLHAPGVQLVRSLQRPPQIVIDAAAAVGRSISISGSCAPYVTVL